MDVEPARRFNWRGALICAGLVILSAVMSYCAAPTYFGSTTPEFYHINYVPLPAWPPPVNLRATYVLALSATRLQGIYNDDFIDYSSLQPTEVLGGTIYLYDLRPRR